MPKGKGTYGNQRGRPRKDAASSMYQKRGPKYKRYSDVTSKTVDTIEEEQKAEVKKAEGKATKAAAMKDASSTMDRLIGSKKGEYKRRDKTAAHPEGHRAGDVGGHYKAYEKKTKSSGFGDVSPAEWKKKQKDASSTMDRLIGSKEGEYKRRDKTAKHPEGKRAGDVGGHYKAYMKEEKRKLHRKPRS